MAKTKKVLLTGVTGFVGKVVLEELIRRRDELGLDKVYCLIRTHRKGNPPEERFIDEVMSSPCFSRLPDKWHKCVDVFSGNLSEKNLGLNDKHLHKLQNEVTHVINCAASIEFDLPVQEAALANITGSLNVLELARACPKLENMVNVSTAYVSPYPGENKPLFEELHALPRPAATIYKEIVDGTIQKEALLQETGHLNTYTLTKCLAEHLLHENKAAVPLTFVRPSIISACWQFPFPGWIDSIAAFGGFVALIGSGYMRTLQALPHNLLDMIPCDTVATRIINAAFTRKPRDVTKTEILFAVAGVKNSCRIDECASGITEYYSHHPVSRIPELYYTGPKGLLFTIKEWQYHRLPTNLLSMWYGMLGQTQKKKSITKLKYQLCYLNSAFPYFTHNTFDFRASIPLEDKDFTTYKFIQTVCEGVYRYVMKRNEREILLAGSRHTDGKSDLKWALKQPRGNAATRFGAYLTRKVLRKCVDQVTFDKLSFEEARRATPKDHLFVIIPTHRSYLDFVLCSYLFFAHPQLNIAIPHIAAAEEFGRIPILGWLLKKANAFYIKRGVGKKNQKLTKQVHELIKKKQTLEFFIEGTRSRSRQFLKPRRGLLKCLQDTEQPCSILPIAISYDELPEQKAFLKELTGADKPKMTLRSLLNWVGKLIKGEVRLGGIHISCGHPLPLYSKTDTHSLSRSVMAQLQTQIVATTYHLNYFLKLNPIAGMDLNWLKEVLLARGGRVIDSRLECSVPVDPCVEICLRYHWLHLFYDEARRLYPNNAAIQHHLTQNNYIAATRFPIEQDQEDARIQELLKILFKPICDDYVSVIDALGSVEGPLVAPVWQDFINSHPNAHLPNLQAVMEDLLERQIIIPTKNGSYEWGPFAANIEFYREACAWSKNAEVEISESPAFENQGISPFWKLSS